jgi:hypothetical protein
MPQWHKLKLRLKYLTSSCQFDKDVLFSYLHKLGSNSRVGLKALCLHTPIPVAECMLKFSTG